MVVDRAADAFPRRRGRGVRGHAKPCAHGHRHLPGETEPTRGRQPGRSIDGGGHPGARPRLALPDIVHWFKTKTTDDYIRGVKQDGWPPFPGRLWQHSYYERAIRDDDELERVRHYIAENPANWDIDPDNRLEALR